MTSMATEIERLRAACWAARGYIVQAVGQLDPAGHSVVAQCDDAVGREVPSIDDERFRTPGAEWTTYRRADGEMIYGEYAFVTELEWFESDDEPTDLIEETWVLQSARKLTVNERPPADA